MIDLNKTIKAGTYKFQLYLFLTKFRMADQNYQQEKFVQLVPYL